MVVRILNQKNVDLQDYSNRKCGGYRERLLHLCAHFNHEDKTTRKLLLEYGADINATDMFGKSPLHTAVASGNYEMAEWLLDNGALVDSHNKDEKTPLHFASIGNIDLCILLLNRGADANYRNKDRETPFLHAVKLQDTKIVKLMLEYGADINTSDKFGESPLHTAVSCGNYEMAKWLLDNGALVNSHNIEKKTPLHYASNGNIDLCILLLNRGADANYRNKDRETPLLSAVKLEDTKIVKLMLTYGGDVSTIIAPSQHIQNLCEQNKRFSAGKTCISQNHRGQILVFIYLLSIK